MIVISVNSSIFQFLAQKLC